MAGPFLKRRFFPMLAFAVAAMSQLDASPTPPATSPSVAPAAPGGEEAAAWKALEDEGPPQLVPPGEWATKRPDQETIHAWLKKERERLTKLADQARDFYIRYPKDPNVPKAERLEYQALAAARIDDEATKARIAKLETAILKNPGLPTEERLQIRSNQVLRDARTPEELEKGARELLKEFPGGEAYGLLLACATAAKGGSEHSRAIAEEVLKSNAPEAVKQEAKVLLSRQDRVGKPLEIQFTALDGREVDLKNLKGKVVLIDFWATWCGPCVAEIPNVKAAYTKLHDKGFDIVGLSFDTDKTKLEEFVKEKEMPWPQYFDGGGWKNKFGTEFGINSIPTMWLVDKKGILRDVEARGALEEKVEKLLAEP